MSAPNKPVEINFGQVNYKDFSKKDLYETLFNDFLEKIFKIVVYKNLPDNVSARQLELTLLKFGYGTFFKINDKYYFTFGALTPPINYEYLGTHSLVTNPYIPGGSKDLEIGKDCIVIKNNELYRSCYDTIHMYVELMTELYTSLRMTSIVMRVPFILDTDDDQALEDNKKIIDKIINGEMIGLIGRSPMFEGIKSNEFSGQMRHFKELLEAIQFVSSKLYNEFGIQSNFNMKREAVNSSEIASNEETLIPKIYSMFECRKKGIEEINKLFGLNISVELNTPWKENYEEQKIELDIKKGELNATE